MSIRAKIDLDAINPDWALTLMVRGREVVTLSPLHSGPASTPLLRSGLVGIIARALSGLSEAVFGASPLTRLRHAAAQCVHPNDRALIRSLSAGEVLRLIDAYEAAQQAWQRRIAETVAAEVASQSTPGTAPAPAPGTAPNPGGTAAAAAGLRLTRPDAGGGVGGPAARDASWCKVTPGGRLPQFLGGHPVGRARAGDGVNITIPGLGLITEGE